VYVLLTVVLSPCLSLVKHSDQDRKGTKRPREEKEEAENASDEAKDGIADQDNDFF
jgi:hypothetical protein